MLDWRTDAALRIPCHSFAVAIIIPPGLGVDLPNSKAQRYQYTCVSNIKVLGSFELYNKLWWITLNYFLWSVSNLLGQFIRTASFTGKCSRKSMGKPH